MSGKFIYAINYTVTIVYVEFTLEEVTQWFSYPKYHFYFRMSKLERLNARVAKLLTEAVQEVLELVKETVSEYQEKTARTQRENKSLQRRLQELQGKISRERKGG